MDGHVVYQWYCIPIRIVIVHIDQAAPVAWSPVVGDIHCPTTRSSVAQAKVQSRLVVQFESCIEVEQGQWEILTMCSSC